MSDPVDTTNTWCRERLSDPADDLFYAVLFAPRDQRARVRATAALFVELEAIVTRFNDMHVARTKLAWWRDELERLANGSPAHPATRLLAAQAGPDAAPALIDLVTGMELILLEGPPTDLATARMRGERGGARLAAVLALQAGADAPGEEATAELGIAIGLARVLSTNSLDAAERPVVALETERLLGANAAAARAAPAPLRVLAALAWRRANGGEFAHGRARPRARALAAWRAARGRMPRKMSTIRA